ncbi:uncharacterized protein LOC121804253 [Salvia splendens]|uniref:uncharacterized protein LOC121804253 n=1 Tax=Salvia splendens TaxID=180675 RepID=UPI001C252D43|nr:uncharacterized protein LOC121804253 [Salvia splendens]XP_042059702.1 uncharacterized protein LOC121804253 [Salvia splendens]
MVGWESFFIDDQAREQGSRGSNSRRRTSSETEGRHEMSLYRKSFLNLNCPDRSVLVDLNLDTERSNNDHWLDHKNAEFSNPGSCDFNFNISVCSPDFSSIQHMDTTDHTLMASPQYLQQMELVPRHILSSGTMPYDRYFHKHGIFPWSITTPHTDQFVHEQSTSSKRAPFAPKLEAKTEELLTANGSKSEGPMYFPFLSNERMMHQEAWYAASLKRKEPEGGLNCLHLGYEQLT